MKRITRRFWKKYTKYLLAAMLAVSMAGGQMQPAFARGQVEKAELFPDCITIEEPTELGDISLPDSRYGVLSWANEGYTPGKYSTVCKVYLEPYDEADRSVLEKLSGWDEEEDALVGEITVIVTSFAKDEEEEWESSDYEDTYSTEDYENTDSWEEDTETEDSESSDADTTENPETTEDSNEVEDEAADTESEEESEDAGAEDSESSDADATENPDMENPENTEDSNEVENEEESEDAETEDSESSDADVTENPDAENKEDSNEIEDETADTENEEESEDAEVEDSESSDADATENPDTEVPENDNTQNPDTDVPENDDTQNPDTDVPENDDTQNLDTETPETEIPEDSVQEVFPDIYEDETNIFDRPSVTEKDDTRSETVEEGLTEEEMQQLAEQNHTCDGISVYGADLPWYVQFRATSGDEYSFENETKAVLFKAYEFELWDLKNQTEYKIPDGSYISVTMPVVEGYEYVVEHLLDNGAIETIIPSVNGNTLVFSTHSFSPFGIAGSVPLIGSGIMEGIYQEPSVSPTPTAKVTATPAQNNSSVSDGNSSNGGSNSSSGDSNYSGTNSSGNSGTQNNSSSGNSGVRSSQWVNTGDATVILPFVIMILLAGVLIVVIVVMKKNK